jgi:hypothetical protein
MKKFHFSGFGGTLLVFSLFLLPTPYEVSAQWQSKNRVQIGCELDNNIYETHENSARKPSLRLLFQSQWERRTAAAYLNFCGVIGYQGYATEAREDKITDEWQLRFEQRLGRRFTAGLDGWARLKHFLFESIDYHSAAATGFLRANLPRNWAVVLSLQPQMQDYWASTGFDQHGLEMNFALNKSFSRQLTAEVTATRTQLNFTRQAYWQPTPSDSLVLRGTRQTDRMGRLALNVRYYRGFLVSGSYFYESYLSNNFGLSYASHRWLGSFSKKISPRLLLRLYAMLQKKNYHESLAPLTPLQLDPERNESNFLILDISRSLAPETSLFLRLAWYNNESLFRSQYYQKRTCIVGLEGRF